jgi:hypothetical protein
MKKLILIIGLITLGSCTSETSLDCNCDEVTEISSTNEVTGLIQWKELERKDYSRLCDDNFKTTSLKETEQGIFLRKIVKCE